jgi:hypothetical protein
VRSGRAWKDFAAVTDEVDRTIREPRSRSSSRAANHPRQAPARPAKTLIAEASGDRSWQPLLRLNPKRPQSDRGERYLTLLSTP